MRERIVKSALVVLSFAAISVLTVASVRAEDSCDVGVVLTKKERTSILAKLKDTKTGEEILAEFEKQYGSLSNLIIQWDTVSYSKVLDKQTSGRAIASSGLGRKICVHLTHDLPDIEHLADLAHELAHATRLELKILVGDVSDADAFVQARLASRGGEADAFAIECAVKFETLGEWDALCAPYVKGGKGVDVERVVADLYSGRLSASLTGEPYPAMLARQFRAMTAKKLENKQSIQ